MKIKLSMILFALSLLLSETLFANDTITRLSGFKDLPFKPPVVKRHVLSNGMTVYALPDRSLPVFEAQLLIKGGTVYEDIKKDGVGTVMAGLLKNGGTLNRLPSEVRAYLDENAIDISFGVSAEAVEGSVASLKKETDAALNVFFEMLFEPRFDEGEMANMKKRIIDGIKRDMQVSGPIAHKRFAELVYGDNNIWGHVATVSNIKGISVGDVKNYYQRFISPDRMILAVAGDFETKELLKKLETIAGKYPKRELPALDMPPVGPENGPKEKVIRKNFTQSAISVGHLASTRDDPEKYALVLLNDILGGSSSFSNRLTDAVRVKGGLAYEVWSSYGFGPKGAKGLFEVHAKTRNQTTKKALDAIKEEIKKMVDAGVTEEELKRAKDGILKSIVFEYERPFQIVASIARYVHFGYPENYIELYKDRIAKVRLSEVNEAAKKHLHPEMLKTVVVGKYK